MKRWFSLIIAFVFIGVCLCNVRQFDRVWTKWLIGEKLEYEGKIYLWHIIDDFDARVNYKTAIQKYEKSNFGIFFEEKRLTTDMANELIKNGQTPDIITFSKSFLNEDDYDSLLKIKENNLYQKGNVYPFLFDTFSVFVNEDIIYENEVEIGSNVDMDEIIRGINGVDFKDVIPVGFSSADAALCAYASNGFNSFDFEYQNASLDDFAKGKVAIYIGPSNGSDDKELPAYSEYKIINMTTRVRYIGVYSGNQDKNRLQCSKDIVDVFMNDRSQKIFSKSINTYKYGYNQTELDTTLDVIYPFDYDFTKEDIISNCFMTKNNQKFKDKIKEISNRCVL